MGSCCTSDSSAPDQKPLIHGRPGAHGEFRDPYVFKAKNTVVIRHSGGSHLRVEQSGDRLLGNGGKGKLARFEAIPENNGNRVKLKSLHNGKFVRIHARNELDCGGQGGKFTLFKVIHEGQPGHVKLESVHFPGSYIACDNNGTRIGKGGPFCKLELFRM
eukprot:534396_1